MTLAFHSRFSGRVLHYIHEAEGNDRKLAAEFEVPVPFVKRWANGTGRPHPLLQGQIIAWIDEQSRNT